MSAALVETNPSPAVELSEITVRFGDNVANRGVSLSVAAGEVHAVVGENGAGKSTLMRALYGMAPISSGEIRVRGERVWRPSPAEAIGRGIGMVHQHFMLVDTLTVAENVVLGSEPRTNRWGFFDVRAAEKEVSALARRHGLAVDPHRTVGTLSVGEQQRVEILKALYRGARILILDEPTAVLTPPEVQDLFGVLRALRDGGGTVLLVTHKLDEVMAISDRVTVMRRGEVAARFERGAATPDAIARAMVGGELPAKNIGSAASASDDKRGSRGISGKRVAPAVELREMVVKGRGGTAIDRVSLEIAAGEILGVAGVEGNGQEELVAAVVGLRRPDGGSVWFAGSDVTKLSVRARRERGLAFVPADRHRLGLLLEMSVAENLMLGRERLYTDGWGLGIDRDRLAADARAAIARFDVRPADFALPFRPVATLSGGNQQKIVLARELAAQPRFLVAAQPTRGVDLHAAARIHDEIDRARTGGAGVLLVSAELDELLALADRIAVLYRGRLVATMSRADATNSRLAALMTGAAA